MGWSFLWFFHLLRVARIRFRFLSTPRIFPSIFLPPTPTWILFLSSGGTTSCYSKYCFFYPIR